MKKLILTLCAMGAIATVNAQTVKETFESNSLGWTEISSKTGDAIVKDGVMHIEGKNKGGATIWGTYKAPSFIETHCFSNIDVTKNFTIKCDAIAKKINDNGAFGVIVDYIDGGNFIAFVIDKEMAYMQRFVDGNLVGTIQNQLKLKDKRKSELQLEVKSTYQKLQFFVNGMLAIESRYLPLTSNGFGFYVFGEQVCDFDNVEFIQ